ncbi:MAG TPA: MlaE family lipid ABC transporter permease subunit [Casimicrobiaceae bacterium]|nr:MlaE family lipid ABC transporter permease subunit [Casimicrobiaceae bacterium]
MPRASTASPSATLTLNEEGDRLALEGALETRTLAEATRALGRSLKERGAGKHRRTIDLKGLSALDTPGALFLHELQEKGVELTGASPEHKALLDVIDGLELEPLPKVPVTPRWREIVIRLGKGADQAAHDTYAVIAFLGRSASEIARAFAHPSHLRLPSISRHIAETGISALPIVGLMAVMISVVIAYQGVVQLRPYGGEDFTINLVAVSVLREMGVLITAIMVAGRSGSAFAAEIGTMKAREEIDALSVMGLEPMELLVVPRLIALIVTLPLLTFFADIMGLAGGEVISQFLLDVSPLQYVERVHNAADASDLFVGLVKAPIFAVVIGIIGCMHGLRVHGSAESVGRETTRAVVKSIFLVIVLDALFSILFEKLGL